MVTVEFSTGKTPVEALVRCFASCFTCALLVLDSTASGENEETPGAPSIHENLAAALDEAAMKASVLFNTQVVLLARRFVTAWIDERLSSDAWPGRSSWLAKPLQSDWGEGRTAGEWFFEALERLEPTRDGDAPLAGLALRCLDLGFDGRMHLSPMELRELRRNTARRFSLTRLSIPFPPPLAIGDPCVVRRNSCLRWLLPLFATAALALGYWLADQDLNFHLTTRIAPSTAGR